MGKKQSTSKYDDSLEAANSVASLWMEFRKHLRKSFTAQDIQSEEEIRFLEVKSELARLQRFLAQKTPRRTSVRRQEHHRYNGRLHQYFYSSRFAGRRQKEYLRPLA